MSAHGVTGSPPQPVQTSPEDASQAESPVRRPRQRRALPNTPYLPPFRNPDDDDDTFWESPAIRAIEQRMREEGYIAVHGAKSSDEKARAAKYYAPDSMRKRIKLLSNPDVVCALEAIWQAADVDGNGCIDRAEYMTMHRKLTAALNPSTMPEAAMQAAREDWIRDSEGTINGLDKERFIRSWFEVRARSKHSSPHPHRPCRSCYPLLGFLLPSLGFHMVCSDSPLC